MLCRIAHLQCIYELSDEMRTMSYIHVYMYTINFMCTCTEFYPSTLSPSICLSLSLSLLSPFPSPFQFPRKVGVGIGTYVYMHRVCLIFGGGVGWVGNEGASTPTNCHSLGVLEIQPKPKPKPKPKPCWRLTDHCPNPPKLYYL